MAAILKYDIFELIALLDNTTNDNNEMLPNHSLLHLNYSQLSWFDKLC